MKSVVVEIRGKQAAVLSDDGHIAKVKNQNYVIGQVIEMKEISKGKLHFSSAVAVAAVAVFMFGMVGVSAYAYYTPYSYVSLDVNPSIEYTLNRFDAVIKVTGVNDDGEEIVKELNLKTMTNKKVEQVIAKTIQAIKEQGYFDGELEGGIVISTSAKNMNKADSLAEELKQSTEEATSDDSIQVETFSVGFERVQEAHDLGVTPGKLNLVEKLRDSATATEDFDQELWLGKPVKEIMHEIKENRKETKIAIPNADDGKTVDSNADADTNPDATTPNEDPKTKAVKAKSNESTSTITNTDNATVDQENQNEPSVNESSQEKTPDKPNGNAKSDKADNNNSDTKTPTKDKQGKQ